MLRRPHPALQRRRQAAAAAPPLNCLLRSPLLCNRCVPTTSCLQTKKGMVVGGLRGPAAAPTAAARRKGPAGLEMLQWRSRNHLVSTRYLASPASDVTRRPLSQLASADGDAHAGCLQSEYRAWLSDCNLRTELVKDRGLAAPPAERQAARRHWPHFTQACSFPMGVCMAVYGTK